MRNFKSILSLPFLLPVLLTCVPVLVPAQNEDNMGSILMLSGASSEENLDEQELERFHHYLSHPLPINLASRSRLVSSGLLSQYQVASLNDYRFRYGDVLSFSELATIEGFSPEFVKRIKPFLSLASRSEPGKPAGDSLGIRHEATARVSVKRKTINYGAKYRASFRERIVVSAAARSPSSWSGGVTFYGKRYLGKAVLGDYNLRVGQGLSLWSGMSLTGFSTSSSFSRRPTGLSPTWSWSGIGSHRGAAADFQAGRLMLTTFISFPGLRGQMEGDRKTPVTTLGGASIGWFGKNGQGSLTAWRSGAKGKVSADYRYNLYGVDVFWETAFDAYSHSLASVAGASALLGEGWRLNAVARLYPKTFDSSLAGAVRSWTKTSDERGVALGIERYGAYFTADLAFKEGDKSKKQCKLLLKVPAQIGDKTVLSLRMTERIRPYEEYLVYKTGARLDLDYSSAGISSRYGESDGEAWKARARIEGLLCRSLAGLSYLELGRKTDRFSAYLRGTLFIVDNWDDRIYSYERDAPGNFTVPAYYGRGYSVAAVGGGKFRMGKKGTLKIYFRASVVRYPFMREPKPPSGEMKLQAVTSF